MSRVYLVEDDPNLLKSFSRFLRSAGFDTLEFTRPDEFLAAFEKHPPDDESCVVLDFWLGEDELDGLRLLQQLKRTPVPVICLADSGDVDVCRQAFQNGAYTFYSKPLPPEALLTIVREAIEAGQADRKRIAKLAEPLDERERQVLRMILEGLNINDAAERLDVSPSTASRIHTQLLKKLGAMNVAQLVCRLLDSTPEEMLRLLDSV